MNRGKYILSIILMAYSCFLQAQSPRHHIIAYYTGDAEQIKAYPVGKLSHIILSFLNISHDSLTFKNEKQENTLKSLVSLKTQYPDLKIMVSIGGWGGCPQCSNLFASAEHRDMFAKITVELFNKYGADGIDLDWEYPTIAGYPDHKYAPEDKNNFTELVKALRKEMGDRYVLSFAAGGFTRFLEESVDWNAIMPHLDFVNLMTYDLTSGASKTTGHHTPLANNETQKQSADNCITWLLNHGVPSKKLIMGAAFYARVWENVANINNGLYQPGKFKQGVNYKNHSAFFSDSLGFKSYWDKKAKAPYSYSASKGLFATYDDPKSIKAKSKYIRRKKLGGIMFWQLTQDKPTDGLVDVMAKTLNNK
jgi:chitinase